MLEAHARIGSPGGPCSRVAGAGVLADEIEVEVFVDQPGQVSLQGRELRCRYPYLGLREKSGL